MMPHTVSDPAARVSSGQRHLYHLSKEALTRIDCDSEMLDESLQIAFFPSLKVVATDVFQ